MWRLLTRRPHAGIVCFASLWGLIYLLGPSNNHLYADDSLPFAVMAWQGSSIHVHHLALYGFTILTWICGWTGDSGLPAVLAAMKGYAALSAAGALVAAGWIVHRWTGSVNVALGAMAVTACTYGFWAYATVSDFYCPAAAGALIALALAIHARDGRRAGPWLLLSSLAALWATLNHQTHALVAFPIVVALLCQPGSWRTRIVQCGVFAVPLSLGGSLLFYLAYRASGAPGDFITFVAGYTRWMELLPYDRLQPATPLYVLVGFVRAEVFLDYLQVIEPFRERLAEQFPLKLTFDDWYLIQPLPTALTAALAALMTLAAGGLGGAVIVGIAVAWRERSSLPGVRLLMGWMVLQTLLFAWWEPLSNEFWIWAMPCAGILVGLAASRVGRRWRPARWLPWLIAAGLLVPNGVIISRYRSADHCIYHVNKTYLTMLGEGDLVLTADFYPFDSYHHLVGLHASRRNYSHGAFVVDDTLDAQLVRVRARSGAVYLDPMLTMPAPSELGLMAYYTGASPVRVEQELQRLTQRCGELGLPLFLIERQGADAVTFRARDFGEDARWVTTPQGARMK